MPISVGQAVGYLDLDTSRFSSGVTSALNNLNVFASRTATANDRLGAVGKTLTQTGSLMTKCFTLPLASAGASFVKVTSDFDTAMSKVSAISGATGDELLSLRDKAKEMGAKTKFSASEAADAFSYMAMAGWKTEDMLDGIDGIMSLAAASGEDLALTSDIVTDALTAFGLSASDSAHFADILAAASNSANTNVAMLGESFKYVAPVAGALGYSAEDVSVALGLMANAGIKASQGGTALRAWMTNLVKPTDDMAAAMDELGISITDNTGQVKPWMQVMEEMRDAFSGLSEDEAAMYASTIAGKEGMSGLLAVMNASESDFEKLSGAIDNCDGTANKMAETMIDNLGGQFTILKSTLESIAISFGEMLMPYMRSFVEKVQEAADALNNMSEAEKQQVLKISAIVAAIGPALVIIGKVISSVSSLIGLGKGIAAFFAQGAAGSAALNGALTVLTGPIGIVIGSLTALGLGMKHLYDTNEEVRQAMQEAWEGIKSAFGEAFSKISVSLSGIGESFVSLWQTIQPAMDVLLQIIAVVATALLSQLVGAINGVIQALAPFIDTLTSIVDFVTNTFAGIWSLMTGDIEGAKESFANAGQSFIDIFINLWETIKSLALGFVDGVVASFKTAWNLMGEQAQEFVTNLISDIATWFSELPGKIQDVWNKLVSSVSSWVSNMGVKSKEVKTSVVDAIVNFFKELPENIAYYLGLGVGKVLRFAIDCVNTVKSEVPKIINAVVNFFKELPGKMWNALLLAIDKISEWGASAIATAKVVVPQMINAIVNFFKELPGKIWTFLVETVQKITVWGANMLTEAKRVCTETFNGIVNAFKNLPEKMLEAGRNIVEGLINGFIEKANQAVETVKGLGENIIQGFKDAMGIHSPSKVFQELGGYIDQGLAKGLYDNSGLPTKEMDNICREILRSGDEISTGLISIDKESGQLIYDNTYSAVMKKIDLFQKEKDKRVSLLDKGTDKTLSAIDKEIAATQNAYDVKMKLLEQEYNAKIALIDEESAAKIAALNAEIDAITEQQEQEDRAKEEKEYQEELAEKKQALEDAMNAEEVNDEEVQKAKKALEELELKRKEELLKQEREDRKNQLRDEIESVRNATEKNKESIRSEYEEKKWQLEQQKADEIQYLQEMQQVLQDDYEKRKELDEVQTKLKNANQEKLTEKEKQELRKREAELIASIKTNKGNLENFQQDVIDIGQSCGQGLLDGFTSVESDLDRFFDNLVENAKRAKEAADEAREAAESAGVDWGAEGFGGLIDYTDYSMYNENEPQAQGLWNATRSLGISTIVPRGTFNAIMNIDYEKLAKTIVDNVKPTINVSNQFTSPESLNEQTIKREQEQMLRDLAFDYGL